MSEPRLIRRSMRFERNFTQLPNAWLRDESLSFRARGLLSLLMTHENGWHVTLKALASTTPIEGIDALRTAANELEQLGYLKRVTLQGKGGKFEGTTWEICDPHDLGAETLFTALDKPTTAATALDKPTRTALDHPTPIRTPVKNIKDKERNHSARETNNADASGDAHQSASAIGKRTCAHGHQLIDDRHCVFGCMPEAVVA